MTISEARSAQARDAPHAANNVVPNPVEARSVTQAGEHQYRMPGAFPRAHSPSVTENLSAVVETREGVEAHGAPAALVPSVTGHDRIFSGDEAGEASARVDSAFMMRSIDFGDSDDDEDGEFVCDDGAVPSASVSRGVELDDDETEVEDHRDGAAQRPLPHNHYSQYITATNPNGYNPKQLANMEGMDAEQRAAYEKRILDKRAENKRNQEKGLHKKWRDSNKVQEAARGKAYRDAHPEEEAARHVRYYQVNGERIRAAERARRAENLDAERQRARDYHADHALEISRRQRARRANRTEEQKLEQRRKDKERYQKRKAEETDEQKQARLARERERVAARKAAKRAAEAGAEGDSSRGKKAKK
eukprot:TRINITY_DN40440_c0_g1_i1.p1 TRINITY_DN40440_c0_g1~~TRINITY_DN40440_c0_g1_i1.p1  ORF type:complete len:372 (-),score=34.28 TRINITY_DN40440_c0_g1_i1:141-1226(-)